LLEAQSTPLRNYLMQNVMPTMTVGLIECCRVRPDDPIDFLVRIQSHCNNNTYVIVVLMSAAGINDTEIVQYQSEMKAFFPVGSKIAGRKEYMGILNRVVLQVSSGI